MTNIKLSQIVGNIEKDNLTIAISIIQNSILETFYDKLKNNIFRLLTLKHLDVHNVLITCNFYIHLIFKIFFIYIYLQMFSQVLLANLINNDMLERITQ